MHQGQEQGWITSSCYSPWPASLPLFTCCCPLPPLTLRSEDRLRQLKETGDMFVRSFVQALEGGISNLEVGRSNLCGPTTT